MPPPPPSLEFLPLCWLCFPPPPGRIPLPSQALPFYLLGVHAWISPSLAGPQKKGTSPFHVRRAYEENAQKKKKEIKRGGHGDGIVNGFPGDDVTHESGGVFFIFLFFWGGSASFRADDSEFEADISERNRPPHPARMYGFKKDITLNF